MSPVVLITISAVCILLSVFFVVAALRTKTSSDGAQYLIRVTREAGKTRVVDEDSSFAERILRPILNAMTRFGWKLTPHERLTQLEGRLEAAGYPAGWDINRIILMKVLGLFVGVALGLFVCLTFNFSFGLLVIVGLGTLGLFTPDIVMKKAAQARTIEVRRALADTVDILNLTLEAGIGFDSALKLVSEYTKGPLSSEFNRVVQEITIGRTRAEALRALADRTRDGDLRRFCLTCVQADRRGTPLGDILHLQAVELRIKRRQQAEEKAQKVPIKILFPLMIFILPVLMMAVMGPAVIQFLDSGLG